MSAAKRRVVRALAAHGVEADPSRLQRVHTTRCPAGRVLYTVWVAPGHGQWVAGQVDSTRSTVEGETRKTMFAAYPVERVAGHDVPFACRCHPTRRVQINA